MSRDHILHFTIGPVQGFIEQARRTRDFWAGSFLLAWLSSIAINKADEDADIAFPDIAGDDMICRLRDRTAKAPRIGTVPNRFKARVAGDFDPRRVEEAVLTAWKGLAEKVKAKFVAKVAAKHGPCTEDIWKRQIGNFWEIAWVMGPASDKHEGEWLDRRKNWRSHRPPTEAGDHCTLMGDWQEISGWTGYTDRPKQLGFWQAMRAQSRDMDLNLAEGERLCAIALVRRLFPLLKGQDLPPQLWEVPEHWESTGHMAAVRWIAKATAADRDACQAYFDFIDRDLGSRWSRAEQYTTVQCLALAQPFAGIDANLFYRDNIANPRTYQLDDPDAVRRLQKRLQDKHKELGDTLRPHGITKEPRPYYALLRMDGDHVGHLLGENGETVVGPALAAFGAQVEGIVRQNDGVLIYAGGDDLLAFLPLDRAIRAALLLRDAYGECFPPGFPDDKPTPTTSASIVFADHHEPLRGVLRESQRLLEHIAKDKNGRNSLAISLLKPSGRALEWVSAWQSTAGRSVPDAILGMTERLKSDDEISARFSYTLHRRFLATLGDRFGELRLSESELKSVLRATLGKRREEKPEIERNIAALVKELLLIGLPHHGPSWRGRSPDGFEFSINGLRLAFFLAGRDGAEQRDAAA